MNLWGNIKRSDILEVLERGKSIQCRKVFKEIMAGNFSNLAKDINQQIQEAHWSISRIIPKKSKTRHIIIKWLESKEKKILIVTREKWYITYSKKTFQMTVHFSSVPWKPKGSGITFLKGWREKTMNENSMSSEKYFKERKWIRDTLRWRNTKLIHC